MSNTQSIYSNDVQKLIDRIDYVFTVEGVGYYYAERYGVDYKNSAYDMFVLSWARDILCTQPCIGSECLKMLEEAVNIQLMRLEKIL